MSQATQYKFEIEERLREHHLSAHVTAPFGFHLASRSKAIAAGHVAPAYPCANRYLLLISDDADGLVRRHAPDTVQALRRVVRGAIEAEWAVYARLPELDLTPLEGMFLPDGPAYQQLQQVAEQYRQWQWTLTSPRNNPSTKCSLGVKITRVSADDAWARSNEYWYLRWWSLKNGGYVRIEQREDHARGYTLVRKGTLWLVASATHRAAPRIAPEPKRRPSTAH